LNNPKRLIPILYVFVTLTGDDEGKGLGVDDNDGGDDDEVVVVVLVVVVIIV